MFQSVSFTALVYALPELGKKTETYTSFLQGVMLQIKKDYILHTGVLPTDTVFQYTTASQTAPMKRVMGDIY